MIQGPPFYSVVHDGSPALCYCSPRIVASKPADRVVGPVGEAQPKRGLVAGFRQPWQKLARRKRIAERHMGRAAWRVSMILGGRWMFQT